MPHSVTVPSRHVAMVLAFTLPLCKLCRIFFGHDNFCQLGVVLIADLHECRLCGKKKRDTLRHSVLLLVPDSGHGASCHLVELRFAILQASDGKVGSSMPIRPHSEHQSLPIGHSSLGAGIDVSGVNFGNATNGGGGGVHEISEAPPGVQDDGQNDSSTALKAHKKILKADSRDVRCPIPFSMPCECPDTHRKPLCDNRHVRQPIPLSMP